jgi:hypothetical protein
MAEMTEAQRKAFEAALARSQVAEQQREQVPTQRRLAAFQGLSFGTADEIEARAISLYTGRPYEEVLDEVRGKLKAYQEARPLESMAYEIGGALIPALLPGGQSSLLRAGGRAAAEGAAYAFGTGEGGFQERLARVPAGAAVGAGAGAAGYGAAKALGGLTNRLVDSARRTLGNRGSTIVENEIQRLVRQTERTPDQITQDIIDGRLLAENKSIQAAVRALRTQGGEASTIIQRGMVDRPAQTRAAAMAEMRQYLGDAGAGSQAAARRASEEATVAAERAAYAPFARQVAPDEVVEGLADTLRRVPSAAKEVELQLRAETGSAPFFTVTDDGVVEFTRTPTVAEAESIRRAVQNRASTLYREGMGGAGGAVRGAEQELRGLLDMSIPELATTRAQAAAVRANRDAYEAGQKALAGDVNEKLADFEKLAQGAGGSEAVAAFRAGFMQALEARAATGARESMIRNLLQPDKKESMILRQVFPQDQLDDVLKTIETAAGAQEAASKILIGTGSQTTETALEAARQGLGLSAEEVSAVLGGSPVETLSVASKIMKRLVRTELTDAERARIAEILVSTDPQIVRNAIVDESGMQRLADAVNQIMTGAQNVARGAAATQAGAAGGEAMPMQGLLAQ